MAPSVVPSDSWVECLIADIVSCYTCLDSQRPGLAPSPEVNRLFSKLVRVCSQTLDEAATAAILEDPRIVCITNPLRQICSEAEYKLEEHWVDDALRQEKNGQVNETLRDFTYYENYVDLVRMELSAIHSVTPGESLESIAVLGSGPLPLTSICISQSLENRGCRPVWIHNVDRDPVAITKSLRLCRALGHTEKSMSFHCADVLSETLSLGQFDVVYLAALVGTCHGHKHEVIASVAKRMRPGALLVARSAHSLRGLLYPVVKVSEDLCGTGLTPVLAVHPYNHIINSVIICRVQSRFAEKSSVGSRRLASTAR
ncbi:MAG: hypothetical protein Q9191_007996 [Dirinaria sp. TL-2023a]